MTILANIISALERGVNKLTVPMLLEYCKVLHLTPNDILGYTKDMPDAELLSVLNSFDNTQREQALRILKAL